MNEAAERGVPKKFYWISALALAWNLTGLMAYVAQVTMSAETLAAMPESERLFYETMPAWVTAAFATAVTAGALGSVLLILRSAWALPVLGISLAAVLVQLTHGLFVSDALAVLGASSLVLPLIITVVACYLIWFANSAKQEGWLH